MLHNILNESKDAIEKASGIVQKLKRAGILDNTIDALIDAVPGVSQLELVYDIAKIAAPVLADVLDGDDDDIAVEYRPIAEPEDFDFDFEEEDPRDLLDFSSQAFLKAADSLQMEEGQIAYLDNGLVTLKKVVEGEDTSSYTFTVTIGSGEKIN